VIDVRLVAAAALSDVALERRQRGPEVDEQVRWPQRRGHGVVHGAVAGVVAGVHDAVVVKQAGEDGSVLVHGPVLDHAQPRVDLSQVLSQPGGQEEHLRMEGVPRHVTVEVLEVRVLVDCFVDRGQMIAFGQDPRQRGLARTDVPSDRHVETAGGPFALVDVQVGHATARKAPDTRSRRARLSVSWATKSIAPASMTSTGYETDAKCSS